MSGRPGLTEKQLEKWNFEAEKVLDKTCLISVEKKRNSSWTKIVEFSPLPSGSPQPPDKDGYSEPDWLSEMRAKAADKPAPDTGTTDPFRNDDIDEAAAIRAERAASLTEDDNVQF